ncbi:MAG: hypothetical protein COA43_03565 [Robiginitomaculum sp.]|nr:MAG: hypothetical protein COA43_03565 [Robiginitomaculum sp.]
MVPKKNMKLMCLAFLAAMFFPSTLLAQTNDSNYVKVCNKGNVNLDYVAYATKKSFLGGAQAKVSGWYTIKPRKCQDVNLRGYQTVALGFLQTNAKGIQGNLVYNVRNATHAGGAKWSPRVICVSKTGRINAQNSTGVIAQKFKPPCHDGKVELRMSFAVKPNDAFPTFNLKPRGSDQLVPWLRKASSGAPSSSSQNTGMNGIEVAARILLGAAQGLEDAKIKKLSSACESSVLVFAFTFSKEGPVAACKCLSQQIVRFEPANVVSGIISRIDAGADYETAMESIPEAHFEKYMGACVSTSKPKSTSVKKIELTFEQQALVLFPDPSNSFYKGEPAFNDPKRTRRIQGYMTRWEQLSGLNFLTDHWSMKHRVGRSPHGVLAPVKTLYDDWPNLYTAYVSAEETILNNYRTEWFRVATIAEMQQCIKPPAPKRPRACNDPKRAFTIPECFQSSDWKEPKWCYNGYDRTPHMTSIVKTAHANQNLNGSCLVKAGYYQSPLRTTRNNGKEIKGYFFKDNLLKNAFVSVECGPVWRDFATAVYNARTDQEFVTANPLQIIISNLNVKAAKDIAAYKAQMVSVKRQRINWIASQRSK